jgi:hypothetical protein
MLFQLKIHGYGYQYLFFNEEHYFTVALKEITIENVNDILFDSEKLSKLRIYNKSAGLLINTPYLAEPSEIGFFYGMDLFSRLEVKPKTGKRIKFKFYELRNEELLFGFPNVTSVIFEKKGILILEKCMGYFGKTSINAKEVKFEDLMFELTQIQPLKENLIAKIYYNNNLLDFTNDELICQSKRAFVL